MQIKVILCWSESNNNTLAMFESLREGHYIPVYYDFVRRYSRSNSSPFVRYSYKYFMSSIRIFSGFAFRRFKCFNDPINASKHLMSSLLNYDHNFSEMKRLKRILLECKKSARTYAAMIKIQA